MALGGTRVPPQAVDRPSSGLTGRRTTLPVGSRIAPVRFRTRDGTVSPLDQFECHTEYLMFGELLDRRDVVIVDTETTGFGRGAEVIQVAALNTQGDLLLEELILPEGDIPYRSTKVHGWTRASLRANGAQSWMKAASRVLKCLEGSSLVLAWNAPFDERLIRQTCARHGVSLPQCNWRCCMQMYRGYRRSGKSRLGDATRQEGVPLEGSHDAVADCQTVLAVMRKVASRGQGGYPDTNRTRKRAGYRGF